MNFSLLIIVLCYIIVAIFLLHTILDIYGVQKSNNYLRKIGCIQSRKADKRLIILIPIYLENDIITETIDYFSAILKSINDIELVFVTTEKEGKSAYANTIRLIKETSNISISCIHCPYPKGHKAHQLNYAIKKIAKRCKASNNLYFGFFDADSRPDINGLGYVLNDVEHAKLYQMVSKYYANTQNASLFNIANAIFQTRWSLCFEYPNLIVNYNAGKAQSLMYLIGHGLFIRSDILLKYQFPEYSLAEDISLGYRFSYDNIVAKPVPFFDCCTVPVSVTDNIKQTARWFSGELSLFREFVNKSKEPKLIRNIYITLKRIYLLLLWLFGSPVYFIALLYSAYSHEIILLCLAFFSLFIYIVVLHNLILKFTNVGIPRVNRTIYFYIFLRSSINFIGPLYGIIRVLCSKMRLVDYNFDKTKRCQVNTSDISQLTRNFS